LNSSSIVLLFQYLKNVAVLSSGLHGFL